MAAEERETAPARGAVPKRVDRGIRAVVRFGTRIRRFNVGWSPKHWIDDHLPRGK
jgi:hypothetical protein